MPVVKMMLAEMAILRDFDRSDIVREDRLTAEVAKVDSSNAHVPFFLIGPHQ